MEKKILLSVTEEQQETKYLSRRTWPEILDLGLKLVELGLTSIVEDACHTQQSLED